MTGRPAPGGDPAASSAAIGTGAGADAGADAALPPFRGAVLTGGGSRRMGRDKAFVEFGGRPLVTIAVEALLGAGATHVTCIGGDLDRLRALGLRARPDQHPGEGPLGALADALADATHHPATHHPDPATGIDIDIVMVLTCDLPLIDATVVRPVVAALAAHPGAAVAAPDLGGRPQLLSAAYRAGAVRDAVEAAFAAGERAVRAGLRTVPVVPVRGLDELRLRDADTPAALAQLDRLRGGLHPPSRPPG